ncbi:hypothetical protein HQ496_06820 [bacterium]|nr:hypothetical protein [bacterium]
MKKVLAALGVVAFVLVLLVKPFEFIEVYSLHAGHVAHAVTAEDHDGHTSHSAVEKSNPNQSQSLLMELASAKQEASSFQTSFWLVSLLGIGLITFALSVRSKNNRERDQE